MANIKMVVVNGIRYRPEEAPDQVEVTVEATEDPAVKQRVTKNKARQPRNKSAK